MKDQIMKDHPPASKWWVLAPVVILLSAVAGSCGDDSDGQIFTDDDIGTEVEVAHDEQFEIHLESAPSTGYTWELSVMTVPDLVELMDRTHVSAESGLVGAAGTDVFVLTATGRTAGILRLEYVRSFDDPIVPERVAEFIVRIDGAELTPPPGTPPPTNTAVAPG
jgi:predicted secreted protein